MSDTMTCFFLRGRLIGLSIVLKVARNVTKNQIISRLILEPDINVKA